MAKCKFCGMEVPQKELFRHWNEQHPEEAREMRSKGGKSKASSGSAKKRTADEKPTEEARSKQNHPDKSKKTPNLVEAAMLEFVGQTIQVPNTPALIYGFFCARKMGFEGNIAQFITEVIDDFFVSREINYYKEVMEWEKTGRTITPDQEPQQLVAERA